MSSPSATSTVPTQYEQALQLLAGSRNTGMNPETMKEIARLLQACSDAEKCVVHFMMDNQFVGDNQFLRFHWLLTKAALPGCMPADRQLWRELLAIAAEGKQGTECRASLRRCSTAGCGGKHVAQGLCRQCYDRARDPQRRWESFERWRRAHPDKVRELGRRRYWRHRDKILKREAEKRWAQGHLPRAEYVARQVAQSRSGYHGVRWHQASGLWHAGIYHNGKRISLKYHKTKEEAARAYDAKAREVFGPAAILNFPLPAEGGSS